MTSENTIAATISKRAKADIALLHTYAEKAGEVAATCGAAALIAASAVSLPALADVPSSAPSTLVYDDVGIVQKGNEQIFNKGMSKIRENKGITVRFVLVRSLPFGESPDDYAAELAEQWGLGESDVLFVASTKLARAGVYLGEKAEGFMSRETAESVANETYALGAGDERYGMALVDVNNRLIPVLNGEEDPGPPSKEVNEVVQTYKTKAETKGDKSKYITVVVVVLIISFVAPLLQTYWYVRDD